MYHIMTTRFALHMAFSAHRHTHTHTHTYKDAYLIHASSYLHLCTQQYHTHLPTKISFISQSSPGGGARIYDNQTVICSA